MPRHQYQGTPLQPPTPIATVRSGNTTAASAGTKFLWLQYRNRAGYSLPSASVPVAIAAGEGLDVVIPAAALPSPNGCCIWEYVLLMSDSNTLTGACVVAAHPGYEADEVTVQTPPFTISLLSDEHFKLSGLVPL